MSQLNFAPLWKCWFPLLLNLPQIAQKRKVLKKGVFLMDRKTLMDQSKEMEFKGNTVLNV